jgi:MerR family copper efflux transcriptional regulator
MSALHRLPLLQLEEPDVSVGALAPEEDLRDHRGLMQIGDLAKETGKTVRTIHLYEELGLLSPAARSKGRFRLFDRDGLLRIRWIGKLKEMGFSLGDIQTIVREWEQVGSAPGAMRRMREVYARKLEETQAQQRRLQALEHEIEGSLRYLDTCEVCDPQRLLSACNCCDLHDKDLDVPELVSGFRAVRGRPAAVKAVPDVATGGLTPPSTFSDEPGPT